MHRDPSLVARNAFAIPGALLVFWSFVAIAFLLVIKPHDPRCASANLLYLSGTCYHILYWLTGLMVIGLILLVVGLVRFRNSPAELAGHLYPGTGTHVGLAILASLFVVPLLAGVIQWLRGRSSGTFATTEFKGVPFDQWYVLLILALVGLLIFVPFLMLYVRQASLRRTFLRKALDEGEEAPEHEEPPQEPPEEPAPPAGAWPETDTWADVPDEPALEEPEAAGPEESAWPPAETAWDSNDPFAPEQTPPDPFEPQEESGPDPFGSPDADAPEELADSPFAPDASDDADPFGAPDLEEVDESDPFASSEPEQPWSREPEEPWAPEPAPWQEEESLLPGESVARPPEPGLPDEEQADVEARVDAILRQHPEVDSVHYTGVGRCIAQTTSGSCGATVEEGRHYCADHECLHENARGVRCHKPRIGETKYCLVHGCAATTKSGGACKNPAVDDSNYCRVHQDER